MTTKEAQAEINRCEQQFRSAYSPFEDSARAVSIGAVQAAESAVYTKMVFPVLILLAGVITMLVTDKWFLGLLIAVAGGLIARKVHESAKEIAQEVARQAASLNSTLRQNELI